MTSHISKIAALALMLVVLASCILGCTPSRAATSTPSVSSSATPTFTIASSATSTPSIVSSATPIPTIASSATPEETDFPTIDKVFTSENTNLEQIGSDAATYYYRQFMADDIPQYWHITKYEVLTSELMAGDENEFVVWIESYIETDGAGFLIGEGAPNDSEDLSKGGICPEVGREFRIKALGDGQYEIVSIGTGGGTQDLDPVETTETEYELVQLCKGLPVTETLFVTGDDTQIIQDTVFSYMTKSAAWPGVDIDTLDECYRIRTNYWDDTATDYYAYLIDGQAVMQRGIDGFFSRIDDNLYQELVELVQAVRLL